MREQRLQSGNGVDSDEFWGKNVPGKGIASEDVLNRKVTGMFEEEQDD